MTKVHPTSIIHPKAQLGEGVEVGPFCCIGPDVTLGANVRLMSHVVIDCRATIGAGTVIYPFVSINQTQDKKYHGEPSEVIVGENNTIREYVTLQPGTEGGGMVTRIGNNNLLMIASHVAHDCQIGNHVVMSNGATLGGHVHVGDYAILGGLSAVHQFVRIGEHTIIGGMSGVERDVIPYGHVKGERASLSGLNLIGLKRRGFHNDTIQELRNAYQDIFEDSGQPLAERVNSVANKYAKNNDVMKLVGFIQNDSSRSLCLPQSNEV
jgi:UDP-N-acetylglucosamine acyltransferase